MRGVLSPEAPRAQEGDKRGSPSVPAITSGSEVLGVKALTSGVAWGLDPAPRQRDGQKEPSWVHLARKTSRRRVRSEIADSTAPGPGGVLTGRLGGGLYVYETSFFCRHNSRAHDRAQAARACRSTALTTPELTASGPSGPGPGRPGHARERTCPSASISRLAPGSEITPACGGRVSFVTETPRARGGDKRGPVLPAISSGSRVLRSEMLTQALTEPRAYASPTGLPERARPWLAARPVRRAASPHTRPEI